MADTTSPQDKPRRKPTTTPAESAIPDPTATVGEPTAAPLSEETRRAADATAGEPAAVGWLRYIGQARQVFMDLGSEIAPGELVHPRDELLRDGLLARGDFEPAAAPARDDAGTPQQ